MPDLNSVPPSPHFLASSSRRASSQMPPPPAPGSPSLNILPSNQSAVNASSSSALPSPNFPTAASSFPGPSMGDNTGVGPGPGPLRHPRPLTAADLHLQLEKEQEAVVNRLTRELSILRAAQNASVVSNASSTSASASGTEPNGWADTPLGGSHYHPIRHHRTSSSTSARSFTANVGSVSTTSLAGISSPAPVRPSQPYFAATPGGIPLSRQNSSASRRSRAGSPSPAPSSSHPLPGSGGSYRDPASLPGYFAARGPVRSQSGNNSNNNNSAAASAPTGTTSTTTTTTTTTNTTSELSPGILPATSRYEETALRRAEFEEMRRENEALRRRVRELERMVREAQAQREGHGQGSVVVVGLGVPEEEVRVGESAASAGREREMRE